jgi:UDP-N-acetylmuramoyl-tripeptide--D-alanyl-D-alanine ligase
VLIVHGDKEIELRPSFAQAHNLSNLLAAVAAVRALGHTPSGRVDVEFSAMRGQREALASGVVLVDDCYNANPMSMRAAIDDLAQTAPGRRVAVLGDMLELGPDAERLHREIGEHAGASELELVVAVGPLAAQMSATFAGAIHCAPDAPAAAELVPGLLRDGDTVLVKGSRGVGLERVVAALRAGEQRRPSERSGEAISGEASSGEGRCGEPPAVASAAPGRR